MSLPIIRGSSTALYPFTKTISTLTRVHIFQAANEQRYAIRPPLVNFTLPFNGIRFNDLQALRGAHASAKGQAATNLSLIHGSNTYTDLTLMDDRFDGQEYAPRLYRGQYRLRQTVPQTLASNANSNVYPITLSQLPFTRSTRSQTYVQDQEAGPRYSYGEFGEGLTNFPASQLLSWEIQYNVLSDAEMPMLEQFFIAMNGRLQTFSFTDPEDGTFYTGCRFDQDDLDFNCQQVNQTSVAVKITTFH